MNILLTAILLGFIEGLTEFLPVSSTGHMVIAMPLLGVDAGTAPWKVLLWVSQFAAILAVVLYFWRDLWKRVFRPPRVLLTDHILTKLFVAMVPTVMIGLALKDWLDPLERLPAAVAAALILGAGVMEYIDRRHRRNFPQTLEDVTLAQAFWIGVIQSVSIVPGVSRAGASIMGGMVLGLTPPVATEFSFYLAIPTMLGASLRTVVKYRDELNPGDAAVLLAGSATAFVVALLVVAAFMSYVRRYRFTVFAIYRVLLGAAVLTAWWLGWAV